MYPLQVFQFKPFNYQAVNQQLGLPRLKQYGLTSLSTEFQTHLQTGFDVYKEGYLMFQPAQKPNQKWSQQRARLKASGKPSLADMRRQVKVLQKAGKELTVGNILVTRQQIASGFARKKMWGALEELCSKNDAQRKQFTDLNKQIGTMVQFINFSSDALLFITQEILPNLYEAVSCSLHELRKKKGKVDPKFYQAYETYLIQLSEQLLGNSSEQSLSEIAKLQESMFARLACFALYGHDDVLAQLHQELNQLKKVNGVSVTHAQIPAVSKMNQQAFEEFHRIIAFFGRKEGKERLKVLPWFQSQAIEGMIPMENIITDSGCFIIPTEFKEFIPKETSIPEWLFLGTTLRYWFFRDQFYELARLNTSLAEVKQTLEQEQITHAAFLSAHKHVNQAQLLLQNLHAVAKQSRLGWFARIFFGDADQMIKRWQVKLSATAKQLNDWQFVLNEQFVKQESDFLLSELTAEKHEAVQTALQQGAQNQKTPELQARAKVAKSTYADKTNVLGRFLQKLVKESISDNNERIILPLSKDEISAAIAQCIRLNANPKLQATYRILEALLLNELSFAESSVEAIEQQLHLILEQAAITDISIAPFCKVIAKTYLLPKIKDSANPAFVYVKRWAPLAVELWWQQHEVAMAEFLVVMRKLFVDIPIEGKQAQLREGIVFSIKGHEQKLTLDNIRASIREFYAIAQEFPQYQEELHTLIRQYLKTYTGQDNAYQSIVVACTDKNLYLEYSSKRLRTLLNQKDYRELANDATFSLNPPDEYFAKEWSAIIHQHLSTMQEWDLHLLALIEKLQDEPLAQDYRFMALAQQLNPQFKNAVNGHAFTERTLNSLLTAYGAHHINELIRLIRNFIDNYVDNEAGLQMIEGIFSEEFVKTYQCESLKQDFYTLKKRVLLMKQLQEHKIVVEQAIQTGHYADAVDPILSLYTRWKTAQTPLESQECLKVLQVIFNHLGSHIRQQISKLNYQTNIDLKRQCLDKLPKDIPIHPDTTFLSVLCDHQEIAYLCWYDVRDRQRFLAKQHRNFKAFKNGVPLSTADLETLSIYSRLWELEADVYQSTRAKQIRQTHEAAVGQLHQIHQQQMVQGVSQPMKLAELKSSQQPLHYLRVYQSSNPMVNSQLQQLTELNLLWFLIDTQTTKETTEWQTTMFQWLNAVCPPEQQPYLKLFQKDNIAGQDIHQLFQLWMNVLTGQLMFHGMIELSRGAEKLPMYHTNFCLFKDRQQQKNKSEHAQINQRLQEKYQALTQALSLPAKLDAALQLCHAISQIAASNQGHLNVKTLQTLIHKDGLLMRGLHWLQTAHANLKSEQQLPETQPEVRRTIYV